MAEQTFEARCLTLKAVVFLERGLLPARLERGSPVKNRLPAPGASLHPHCSVSYSGSPT